MSPGPGRRVQREARPSPAPPLVGRQGRWAAGAASLCVLPLAELMERAAAPPLWAALYPPGRGPLHHAQQLQLFSQQRFLRQQELLYLQQQAAQALELQRSAQLVVSEGGVASGGTAPAPWGRRGRWVHKQKLSSDELGGRKDGGGWWSGRATWRRERLPTDRKELTMDGPFGQREQCEQGPEADGSWQGAGCGEQRGNRGRRGSLLDWGSLHWMLKRCQGFPLFPEPSLTASSSLLAGLPAPWSWLPCQAGVASDCHIDQSHKMGGTRGSLCG